MYRAGLPIEKAGDLIQLNLKQDDFLSALEKYRVSNRPLHNEELLKGITELLNTTEGDEEKIDQLRTTVENIVINTRRLHHIRNSIQNSIQMIIRSENNRENKIFNRYLATDKNSASTTIQDFRNEILSLFDRARQEGERRGEERRRTIQADGAAGLARGGGQGRGRGQGRGEITIQRGGAAGFTREERQRRRNLDSPKRLKSSSCKDCKLYLSQFLVKDLKKIAKQFGCKNVSTMLKADLIKHILSHHPK
jgi:hypothetical protein